MPRPILMQTISWKKKQTAEFHRRNALRWSDTTRFGVDYDTTRFSVDYQSRLSVQYMTNELGM